MDVVSVFKSNLINKCFFQNFVLSGLDRKLSSVMYNDLVFFFFYSYWLFDLRVTFFFLNSGSLSW